MPELHHDIYMGTLEGPMLGVCTRVSYWKDRLGRVLKLNPLNKRDGARKNAENRIDVRNLRMFILLPAYIRKVTGRYLDVKKTKGQLLLKYDKLHRFFSLY